MRLEKQWLSFLMTLTTIYFFLIPASHFVLVMMMYWVTVVQYFLLCFCFNINWHGGYGNMHYCENFKAHKKLLNLFGPLFCYIQNLVAIYEKTKFHSKCMSSKGFTMAAGHVGEWWIAGDLSLWQVCLWINRRPWTNFPTPRHYVWLALIRAEGVQMEGMLLYNPELRHRWII